MKIDRFIKGMDVSTIIEEEACGARFFKDGKEDDLFNILKEYGTNSIRIRLWNDPYDENKNPYGAGTNDYEKAVLISRRAKEAGMSTLLDFHYSDFWADPGKQILPKAWKDFNEDQLADAVYTYTKKVLLDLKKEGLLPDMVQIGNEITNGLLWPTGLKPNFDQIKRYVSAGLKAVKVLSKEGIKTNVTLIFSANQALLAARAGATYVSPFLGRLDDIIDTAFKPVVAILVAPSHITSMVDAVVPSLARLLLVAIVALEETNRLLVTHANHNLALLTVLAWSAVGTQQVDVVLGIGNTHRTRLGSHPREGAQRHRCLCLAETFHHADARLLEELLEHGGIQSLTCGGAVLQRREVVLREILANHEAIDGGRCAERGHLIFLHLAQQRVGIELLMIEHEYCGASKPLAIELAPNSLAPTGIGHCEMQRAFVQVVPEDSSC